ncbi:hypothetical protein VTO42DRAFT_6118 [Malbranchea cinnamomea]
MDPNTPSPSPESIGHVLRNTALAFIVLESVFVVCRYVSRYQIQAPTGADDFLMPLAWVFNVALCGITIVMVTSGGVGHHLTWVLATDPAAFKTFLKLQIPMTIMYAMAVMFPKLAILALYLRIFTKPWHRVSCFTLIGLVSAAGFSVVLTACLQCRPLAFMWNPEGHPGGKCIDVNAFWKWGSFPNIVTDFLMLMLPMPCIWKLQLSIRDKIGLVVTFATGSVGVVTSIVRFATFFYTDGQTDATYAAVKLGCCSIAEPGVYLMAACLPTYRSLFRWILRHMGVTTGSSRDRDTGRSVDQSITLSTVHAKKARALATDGSEVSIDTYEPAGQDERAFVSSSSTTRILSNRSYFEPGSDADTSSSCNSAACHSDNNKSPVFGTIRVDREVNVAISNR